MSARSSIVQVYLVSDLRSAAAPYDRANSASFEHANQGADGTSVKHSDGSAFGSPHAGAFAFTDIVTDGGADERADECTFASAYHGSVSCPIAAPVGCADVAAVQRSVRSVS